MKKVLSSVMLLFLISTRISLAQSQSGGIEDPDYDEPSLLQNLTTNQNRTENNEAKKVFFIDQFETINWEEDILIPIIPEGFGLGAGDINGDGQDDLIRTYDNVFDIETADLTDFVNKTLVFFGSNTSNASPDQTINATLIPAGDMDGDGFSDAVGIKNDHTVFFYKGTLDGYLESGIFNFSPKEFQVAFHDFNNDGNDDLLVYDVETPNFGLNIDDYSIIFGDADPSKFQQKDYTVERTGSRVLPVQHGDNTFLVEFIRELDANMQLVVKAVEGENLEATIQYTTALPFGTPNISFSLDVAVFRFDDDDYEELIVAPRNFSGTNPVILENGPSGFSAVSTLLSSERWRSIGDFNGDGRDDLITPNSSFTSIGISSANNNPMIRQLRPFDAGVGTRERRGEVNRPYFLGDLNGDGFDDLQLRLDYDGGTGNQTYFGNSTAGFNNSVDVQYDNEDYQEIGIPLDSKAMDDFNGDGINDFALLRDRRLEIYLGGSGFTSPDFTIDYPDGDFPSELAVGNINGDGLTDIAVSMSQNSAAGNQSIDRDVFFYFGSDNFDTQINHVITTISAPDENASSWSVRNIGDFNHDGFDDFAIMTMGNSNVYIFLGGITLSTSPDVVLELTDSFGVDQINSPSFGFGYRINGVGDINGDDIDDLAVADLSRFVFSSDPAQFANSEGVVFIVYGSEFQKDAPPVLTPDKIIYRNEQDLSTRIRNFGWTIRGVDFNGNGTNDLVILPRESRDVSDFNNGKEAVFIYDGGAEFDENPDKVYPLPATPFGLPDGNLGFTGGELIPLPDLNNDGSQELLYTSSPSVKNAALFLGGSQDFQADAILESPNASSSLGFLRSLVNLEHFASLGDFNNDGILEIILPQRGDRNFKSTPIYFFPVFNPSLNQQTITFEPIDDKVGTDAPFMLTASASSGLPINFEVVEGPATIADNIVMLSGTAGTVTVKASQEGNNEFIATSVQKSFNVTVLTSIAESKSDQLVIFPNPTKDDITIQSKVFTASERYIIRIYSLSGQLVDTFNELANSKNEINLDLNHLQKGIYLLNLQSNEEQSRIRFIKQ